MAGERQENRREAGLEVLEDQTDRGSRDVRWGRGRDGPMGGAIDAQMGRLG